MKGYTLLILILFIISFILIILFSYDIRNERMNPVIEVEEQEHYLRC